MSKIDCKHDWWGIGRTDKRLFVECAVDPCRATGLVELSQNEQDRFDIPYQRFMGGNHRVAIVSD